MRITRGLGLIDTLGLKYGSRVFDGTGAPTNGTSGTGAGFAGPGSLYVDVTNKAIYQNSGTKASPVWGIPTMSAGFGVSNSYIRTDTGTKTLVAAHATKDRGVLVLVTINTTFANGNGAQPVVTIGEADTPAKAMAGTVLVDAAANATFAFGFTNTATKAITATLTAATNTTSTGAYTITVMALPSS
jgi:hypothetical protein